MYPISILKNRDFHLQYCVLISDKVINILGEWHGDTAAGSKNLFKNPRFLLIIPNRGNGLLFYRTIMLSSSSPA